ncbi:DegV family protein [Actinoalloteichus spitiensis]|uniref:DegV family protein n=1 Tax=Actinoalloteichus spitiensis TaxID=252394 RepID=UPI0003681C54|nr:DegV family protein [Actinoalloteichus spitiensis]
MPVAIVTDSTAYLPEGAAERHDIHRVPLHVVVDGVGTLDGAGSDGPGVADALRRHRRVTTSRPSPAEFASTFRALLEGGASSVLSVQLSRELSGTWEAARSAADQVAPDRIRVVDSRSTAMGMGFGVLAAAAASARGADLDEVASVAETTATRTRTVFCLDTLEHLRRGGRLGPATAFLGTALAIRPLLHVDDGRIVPLEKVRTTRRAMTRLVELVARSSGSGPVAVAVHHLDAPERAVELAGLIEERVPGCDGCLVSELGAALGAHTGPGALGAVVLPGGLPAGA